MLGSSSSPSTFRSCHLVSQCASPRKELYLPCDEKMFRQFGNIDQIFPVSLCGRRDYSTWGEFYKRDSIKVTPASRQGPPPSNNAMTYHSFYFDSSEVHVVLFYFTSPDPSMFEPMNGTCKRSIVNAIWDLTSAKCMYEGTHHPIYCHYIIGPLLPTFARKGTYQ